MFLANQHVLNLFYILSTLYCWHRELTYIMQALHAVFVWLHTCVCRSSYVTVCIKTAKNYFISNCSTYTIAIYTFMPNVELGPSKSLFLVICVLLFSPYCMWLFISMVSTGSSTFLGCHCLNSLLHSCFCTPATEENHVRWSKYLA